MKRHKKLSIIIISFLLVVFSVFIFSPSVQAAEQYKDYPEGLKVLPDCFKTGDCDLNDFVQLFVNLAYTGLKVLPYLAMLMMIWAGFNLIMAGGNPEKIQAGKKMITSIVLGVIIVVILAWTWSFFIVVILTGNTTGETAGYIFKDYPWQQEWWGGGEGGIEHVPSTGCCIVDGYGCTETGQGSCISLGDIWDTSTQYMGDYQYCYQFSTVCLSYQVGCCVPKDPDNTTCILPGLEGCLGNANIMRNSQHFTTSCRNIAQCEEFL